MNRQLILYFLSLLLPEKIIPQQTNKLSLEGTALINHTLINGERLISDGGWTSYTDWTYTYYTSTGYSLKFSYEKKLITKNKWSLFFPVGISYMSQINKYERIGESWSCMGGESANELRIESNKNANLFFGFILQYESSKFRYSGSALFTNCFTLYSKYQSTPYTKLDEYTNSQKELQYNLYLSSQFSVLYKFKNNLWIGPSCEIFYLNTLDMIFTRFHQKPGYRSRDYGPSINITGKNIWMAPGIKLQFDLK